MVELMTPAPQQHTMHGNNRMSTEQGRTPEFRTSRTCSTHVTPTLTKCPTDRSDSSSASSSSQAAGVNVSKAPSRHDGASLQHSRSLKNSSSSCCISRDNRQASWPQTPHSHSPQQSVQRQPSNQQSRNRGSSMQMAPPMMHGMPMPMMPAMGSSMAGMHARGAGGSHMSMPGVPAPLGMDPLGSAFGHEPMQMMAMQNQIMQNNMHLARMMKHNNRSGGSSRSQQRSQPQHYSRRHSHGEQQPHMPHHYRQVSPPLTAHPPPQATQPAAPPVAPSLDPALLVSLEQKLSELTSHQSSLVTKMQTLHERIESKDEYIAQLKDAAVLPGATAADILSQQAAQQADQQAERERMHAEMQLLREHVVSLKDSMCTMSGEGDTLALGDMVPSGILPAPAVIEQHHHHYHTHAPKGQASEGEESEVSGGVESPAPRYRRQGSDNVMHTPYGAVPAPSKSVDDDDDDGLNYFVPIMQKEKDEMNRIFQEAQDEL